jgi:23S rRNA (adenine2503-C2)-methyltransferase
MTGRALQPLVFTPPRRGKPPRHLADMDRAERRAVVTALGRPAYRADQVSRHYFSRLVDDAIDMTDLSTVDREMVVPALLPTLLTSVRDVACDDGSTRKSLWRLFDGALVESVLMAYDDRATRQQRRLHGHG